MVYFTLKTPAALKIRKRELNNNNIIDCLIIHRYGNLAVGEKIVMVVVLSEHRKNSLLSCKIIMDYLKKDATFWKKEIYGDDYKWLENTK